jgi:hypothetical protein
MRQFIAGWIVISMAATIIAAGIYFNKYGMEGLSTSGRLNADPGLCLLAQGGPGGAGGAATRGGTGGAGGAGGNVTIMVGPPVTPESKALLISIGFLFAGAFMAMVYFLLQPRSEAVAA